MEIYGSMFTFIMSISWFICTGLPPDLWITSICEYLDIMFNIMAFLFLLHLHYYTIILCAGLDIHASNVLVQSRWYAGVRVTLNFSIGQFNTQYISATFWHASMENYLLITIIILNRSVHLVLQEKLMIIATLQSHLEMIFFRVRNIHHPTVHTCYYWLNELVVNNM